MPKYAKLENNVVVNIVEYENAPSGSDFIEVNQSTQRVITSEGVNYYDGPGQGWTYNTETGRFEALEATAEENLELALQKIQASDWAVLPDIGLTSANVELWKTYRASLRSIIKNETAGDLTWPDVPNKEYI